MHQGYEKKFDRWLLEVPILAGSDIEFTANVTVKDDANSPSAIGISCTENFIDLFHEHWAVIFEKLVDFNSEFSKEDVRKSINPRIFLYAPALVGSITYDLMVLFELKSDVIQHQNCIFCINNGHLVFSEQHI